MRSGRSPLRFSGNSIKTKGGWETPREGPRGLSKVIKKVRKYEK